MSRGNKNQRKIRRDITMQDVMAEEDGGCKAMDVVSTAK